MTANQPPATPPPAPQTPTPTSLGDADATAAAQARIDAAFPGGNQPGAPEGTPPAGTVPVETEIDFFGDEALDNLDFGNVLYKDGAKLKKELFKARDAYRPFRDAFGSMSDDARQALLSSSATLGDDLGVLAQVNAQLHPEDRAYFQEAMSKFASGDVEGGAQMLEDGVKSIRAAMGGHAPPAAQLPPGTTPTPDWATPPGQELPADQQPMTRADFDQALAADRQQREFADTIAREQARIVAEARDLGYDPEATEGTAAYDRYQFLLSVAQQPSMGYDLVKAHGRVQGLEQAAIDSFVEAKAEGSARPLVPAGAGVAPAETRTLESMTDGAEAMRNRLAASLGPDPRQRAAED